MKKIIVTGANGFIGSELIKKCVENEIEVIAIDISFDNSKLPESQYITTINSNLDCVEDLLAEIPCGDYDAFYHLAWAGVNGASKADPLVQVKNIEVAVKCANVAKRINVRKFLCSGTIAEKAVESLNDLETTSGGMMYGVAKHCTHLILESYCKNIDLNFIWMQFSNIYGPKNKTGNLISYTIEEIKKNCPADFGPALQPYDFILVNDLIDAVYKLGDSETSKHFYFIGSGKPRILREYLHEIGKQCGKSELINIGVRPDDGIKYSIDMFDIGALTSDIGYYITMDYEDGIKYTLENY